MRARHRLLVAATLAGFAASVVTVAFISVLLYRQVSAELVRRTEEMLHERLHYFDRTISNAFEQSAGALAQFLARVDDPGQITPATLAGLRTDLPAWRRLWMTFADGALVADPATGSEYLRRTAWWCVYESPSADIAPSILDTGGTLHALGRPFRDELGLDTIIPVIVYQFSGVHLKATAFLETDLTELLGIYVREVSGALGTAGSHPAVALYDRDGELLESTENLGRVALRPLDPANRLALTDAERARLLTSGRLTLEREGVVELYRWDSGAGMIIGSQVPRSAIVASIGRTTFAVLGVGVCSLLVIVVLGLLLVRSAYRMRTFEEQQVRAQLEMLQATMNPHFLFNTLDSMVGVTMSGDRDALLKMLKSLSTMLHMNVRRHDDFVTLEEELEDFASYIEL